MIGFIKYLHVLSGVTFLGLTLAGLFYLAHSITQQKTKLWHYATAASLLCDLVTAPLVIFLFYSGHYLARVNHFALRTPWIVTAYAAMSLVSLAWLLNVGIKLYNKYRAHGLGANFRARTLFYVLSSLILFIGLLIIHDAVFQQTFTWVH